MELTGKCKEDFEKWLQTRIVFCTVKNLTHWFYEQPSMMRYGVYVDFFDSVGIYITSEYVYGIDNRFLWDVSDSEKIIKNGSNEVRQEARTKAIEKAVELYNELKQ